jgi:hypothetical protein
VISGAFSALNPKSDDTGPVQISVYGFGTFGPVLAIIVPLVCQILYCLFPPSSLACPKHRYQTVLLLTELCYKTTRTQGKPCASGRFPFVRAPQVVPLALLRRVSAHLGPMTENTCTSPDSLHVSISSIQGPCPGLKSQPQPEYKRYSVSP